MVSACISLPGEKPCCPLGSGFAFQMQAWWCQCHQRESPGSACSLPVPNLKNAFNCCLSNTNINITTDTLGIEQSAGKFETFFFFFSPSGCFQLRTANSIKFKKKDVQTSVQLFLTWTLRGGGDFRISKRSVSNRALL